MGDLQTPSPLVFWLILLVCVLVGLVVAWTIGSDDDHGDD